MFKIPKVVFKEQPIHKKFSTQNRMRFRSRDQWTNEEKNSQKRAIVPTCWRKKCFMSAFIIFSYCPKNIQEFNSKLCCTVSWFKYCYHDVFYTILFQSKTAAFPLQIKRCDHHCVYVVNIELSQASVILFLLLKYVSTWEPDFFYL